MTIGDDNNKERSNNKNGNNFLVIKPFRELTSKSFPTTKLKNDFKLHWVGCFKTLENSGIDLPPKRKVLVGNVISHPYQNNNGHENDAITQEELDRIYNEFIVFLKQRFTYCFAKKKTARARDCLTSWTIATWAITRCRDHK